MGFNHDTSSYFVKGVRVIGAVPSNAEEIKEKIKASIDAQFYTKLKT